MCAIHYRALDVCGLNRNNAPLFSTMASTGALILFVMVPAGADINALRRPLHSPAR